MMQLGLYRHYKGKEYEVIALGRDEGTLEPKVVYKALYDSPDFGENAVWLRDYDDFCGEVELGGKIVKRFEYVG